MSDRAGRRTGVASAGYRLLLPLLPSTLRAAFGADMAQLFDDRLRDARGAGARIGTVVRGYGDLIAQAVAERLGARSGRRSAMRAATVEDDPAAASLGNDLYSALRGLVRRPGYPALVVIIVALGIGLNAALLSVARTVLVEPLPFAEADRLVVLTGTYEGDPYWSLGVPEVRDLEARSAVFDRIGIFSTGNRQTRTDGDATEGLGVGYASAAFFDLLGIPPLLGRSFVPAEDEGMGNHPVALLGHDYWQRSLGGDPGVVGTLLELGGRPFTVIGVMPERFRFSPTDLWLPLSMGAPSFGDRFDTSRRSRYCFGLARLADARGLDGARREVDAIMAKLAARHPEVQRARGVRLHPLRSYFFGTFEQPVKVLFACAILVLAICFVNVGALLLARALARRRELAIRQALGATGTRLAVVSVVESVAMTLVGGLLGAAFATWAVDALAATVPLGLPAFAEVGVDRTVLVQTLGLVVAAGALVGLIPGLAGWRRQPLRAGAEAATGTRARRARQGLVAIEVALALMLVTGASLMARSVQRLVDTDLGFDPSRLVSLRLDLQGVRFAGDDPEQLAARRAGFVAALLERVEALPGVAASTAWGPSALGNANRHLLVTPEGRPLTSGTDNRLFAQDLRVGPGALGALGIELVAGRDLAASDRVDSRPVVVIDQTMRDRYFPDGALGGTLHLWRRDRPVAHTVVGVARDVRHRGARNDELGDGVAGDVYRPILAAPASALSLLVRIAPGVAVGSVVPSLRRAIDAFGSDVPVVSASLVANRLDQAAHVPRLAAGLLTVYALTAAVFALVGMYALLAYTVRLERKDLAVRSALGARAGGLLARTFGQGMRPVLAGVAVGILGAMAGSHWIESLLFGITRTDLPTYATVAAGVVSASALACYLASRRAATCDPSTVLREG